MEKIFYVYSKYQNLSLVAHTLNDMGYRGKNGGEFTPQAILTIVTNPIYCGFNRYHGKLYKGTHKSIINIDSFNAIQRIIADNRRGRIRLHRLNVL